FRRARHDERQPLVAHPFQQLLCAACRVDARDELALEDAPAGLADRLALRRFDGYACELGQELVATFADERPDARKIDAPAAFGERLNPRPRVGVVAVDERSVDVEDDGAVHDERYGLRRPSPVSSRTTSVGRRSLGRRVSVASPPRPGCSSTPTSTSPDEPRSLATSRVAWVSGASTSTSWSSRSCRFTLHPLRVRLPRPLQRPRSLRRSRSPLRRDPSSPHPSCPGLPLRSDSDCCRSPFAASSFLDVTWAERTMPF